MLDSVVIRALSKSVVRLGRQRTEYVERPEGGAEHIEKKEERP